MPDLPTRFWLARRPGAEDWDLVLDVNEAERLQANPHFEVVPCSPAPADLPPSAVETLARRLQARSVTGATLWDNLTESLRDQYRGQARSHLEALQPFLRTGEGQKRDFQYELHEEQCAHGSTLMKVDRLLEAVRPFTVDGGVSCGREDADRLDEVVAEFDADPRFQKPTPTTEGER